MAEIPTHPALCAANTDPGTRVLPAKGKHSFGRAAGVILSGTHTVRANEFEGSGRAMMHTLLCRPDRNPEFMKDDSGQ